MRAAVEGGRREVHVVVDVDVDSFLFHSLSLQSLIEFTNQALTELSII